MHGFHANALLSMFSKSSSINKYGDDQTINLAIWAVAREVFHLVGICNLMGTFFVLKWPIWKWMHDKSHPICTYGTVQIDATPTCTDSKMVPAPFLAISCTTCIDTCAWNCTDVGKSHMKAHWPATLKLHWSSMISKPHLVWTGD